MGKKSGSFMSVAQKLGKALMTPIAVLPAAAILLRLGSGDLLGVSWMEAAGNAIFGNLSMVFAISIAITFAQKNSGVAAIAAAISQYVITAVAISFDETINLGVVTGIIAGLVSAYLYNRYHNVKVPELLGFFGGKRFVPIVTALVSVVIGAAMGFVWPPVQVGIEKLGMAVISAGPTGSFINGFINRLLLPFGLHHLSNSFVLFQLGEFTDSVGQVVTGDLTRFFAGVPNGGLFVTGGYAVYMFGFPAVALAMTLLAKPENRKAVAGVLGSAALTAIITGITEPIEFSFLFLSPVLLVVNALLFGLFNAVSVAMGVRMGIGFSNGLLDYIMTYNLATKPLLMIPIGIVAFVVYFCVFYFLIKKLNIPTPGRVGNFSLDGGEDESEASGAGEKNPSGTGQKTPGVAGAQALSGTRTKNDMFSEDNVRAQAEKILSAVGGPKNILELEACITRIRLTVKDSTQVERDVLKRAGAVDVISMGGGNFQIVIGTMADPIVSEMKESACI